MLPDKNTVKQLLQLSDDELLAVIKKLCSDNNINISSVSLGLSEVRMLRTVLMNASEADIERFLSFLGGGKNNGR